MRDPRTTWLLALLLAALLGPARVAGAQMFDLGGGEAKTEAEADEEAGEEEAVPEEMVEVRLSLDEATGRALQRSVELGIEQAGVQVAETRVSQAYRARWAPKAELVDVFGVVNQARGDPVFSPDEETDLLDGLGPFNRLEIDLVQPIFTFGKLDSALRLARQGVKIAAADVDAKKAELRERIKLLYYGLLVARDMVQVMKDVQSNLDKAYEGTKEKLERQTGEATNIDLYKIELFRATLQAKLQEVYQRQDLARRTMEMMLGLAPNETFRPADRRLRPPEVELKALEYYEQSALNNRAEVKKAEAGIKAREAQVDMARANLYPDFFIGAKFTWAVAPNRDDQENPFAYDPFNTFGGGPFMGMRWDLAFHRRAAELDTAQAELSRTQAQIEAAKLGLMLKVRNAYSGVVRAREMHDALQRALRSAKKWFRSSTLNYGIGVATTDDLIDAYKNYIGLRGEYLQGLFNYYEAIASLDREAAVPVTVGE